MAAAYGQLARAFVGKERQSFNEACKALTQSWGAKDRKLAEGLLKLVTDRCVFEEETPLDSQLVRATVFGRAAELRRQATRPEDFAREAVFEAAAHSFGQPAAVLDSALYGDLPGAHILKQALVPTPERLLELYDVAQVQAVLLRAKRVVAKVACRDPAQFRGLFRTLKFHQLLFTLTPVPAGGYQIAMDGPFSMFDAGTRYGLKLALALPSIMACDGWSLNADLLWGRERRPLRFRLKGQSHAHDDMTLAPAEPVTRILERWPTLQCAWKAMPSTRLLDLPGVGLCVPDLEFRHPTTGVTVYFELLGYWSRAAVWKRIELCEAGLPFPLVFGVSKSLRVSEEVLGDDTAAALYVFAKVPNARSLLERIERVAARRA
jgi:predicted nuclease of restriction endonuclease-like RecB superfamily